VLAGVAQNNAEVSVWAFVDMKALSGRAAGADIPRCTSAALIQRMHRINGRKMIIEYTLNCA
jgi:hypothetical protein